MSPDTRPACRQCTRDRHLASPAGPNDDEADDQQDHDEQDDEAGHIRVDALGGEDALARAAVGLKPSASATKPTCAG